MANISKKTIDEHIEFWIKNFLLHIEALEYSKNTIMTYKLQLEQFLEFCTIYNEEISFANIKKMHISMFFAYIDEISMKKNKKQLSGATKKAYFRTLKSFFNFISNNNDDLLDFSNLFKDFKIKFKISETNDFNYLKIDEINKIVKYFEKLLKNKLSYRNVRDFLLFKLLCKCGMRISEALNLKLINFTQNNDFFEIRFIGKGGAEQIVYIKTNIVKNELDYISKIKNEYSYIFTTSSGKQLQRTNAYRILNNIYNKCGLDKTGCHMLRHSFAMNLLECGANISVIQKALRHKSVETTMIYANADVKMIQDALPQE